MCVCVCAGTSSCYYQHIHYTLITYLSFIFYCHFTREDYEAMVQAEMDRARYGGSSAPSGERGTITYTMCASTLDVYLCVSSYLIISRILPYNYIRFIVTSPKQIVLTVSLPFIYLYVIVLCPAYSPPSGGLGALGHVNDDNKSHTRFRFDANDPEKKGSISVFENSNSESLK